MIVFSTTGAALNRPRAVPVLSVMVQPRMVGAAPST